MPTSNVSAGLLMYRTCDGQLEVLLVHPGGPLFRGKDEGAWSIPKGKLDHGEDPFDAACREFEEETGLRASGPFLPLTPVRQKSGKLVRAWAFAGDCDPARLASNTFEMEWPPRSGRVQEFPEIDDARFFGAEEARLRIIPAQIGFLDELAKALREGLAGIEPRAGRDAVRAADDSDAPSRTPRS